MKLSFEILSNFALLLEYENSNRISILSNIGFLIADALVYVNTRVAQTERKKNKKTTYLLFGFAYSKSTANFEAFH